MKTFWRIFKVAAHAAIGGFSTAATAAIQTGRPLGSKAVILTGLAGASSAVWALLTKRPQDQ